MQIEGALHPEYKPPKIYLPKLPAPEDIDWLSDDEQKASEVIERIELRESILRRFAFENFLAFFEYAFEHDRLSDDGLVIVHEPIQPQWYQEEWSLALDESKRIIIISPRAHGKSTFIIARIIWELGRNTALRIKIVCAADGKAKERLYEIKNHIENNQRVKDVFPNLQRDKDAEWCVPIDSLISMHDGLRVHVATVQAGDYVLGWNSKDNKVQSARVNKASNVVSRECVLVKTTTGRSFRASVDHKMLANGKKWIPAGQLKKGDAVGLGRCYFPESLGYERVKSITPLGKLPCRDFEIEKPIDSFLLDDGFIAHNSKHRLYVIRDAWHRDASIEALGITSTATGGRADILISDDAVDRRNAISFPKLRQTIKQSWKSDITQLLEPTSKIWAIATPWHRDDLTHELMKNTVFRLMFYAIDDNYGAMFPGMWPESELRLRATEIGSQEFARGFKCIAIDDESQIVHPDWIKFIDPKDIPDDLVFFVSYDTAKGLEERHDYTAGVIIGVDEVKKKVYVVDAWHARLTLSKRADRIYEDIVYWKPYRVLIEETGLSETLSWLLNIHPELRGMAIPINPKGRKPDRLIAVTPLMENGDLLFSTDLDSINENDNFEPGRGDLIDEILEFGFAAHDDMADAFTQAVSEGARKYLLDDWAPGTDDRLEEDIDPEEFVIGGF